MAQVPAGVRATFGINYNNILNNYIGHLITIKHFGAIILFSVEF